MFCSGGTYRLCPLYPCSHVKKCIRFLTPSDRGMKLEIDDAPEAQHTKTMREGDV